jgi:hypothetical protein
MKKSNRITTVNPKAEAAVIDILATLFNPISYMEPYTVRSNVESACSGGMSEEERTMPSGLFDFLVDHFSVIYFGLVSCKIFRDEVRDAIEVEIALDSKDKTFVSDIRKKMKHGDKRPSESCQRCYVLNLSEYDEDFYRMLNARLLNSFEKINEYDDVIDDMAHNLNDDDLLEIGFIAGNFSYLFRAFNMNEKFFHYVKNVALSVEHDLKILI